MSALPNAFRRGAVYWWRRTTCLARSGKSPITLSLSLLTKELGVARGRAAAMTAQSEKVRMSLYKQVTRDGLTHEQQRELFVHEMRAYRDALEHEAARWQADTRLSELSDPARDVLMFEKPWSAFAQTGVVEKPCWTYAETYFDGLDEEEQSRLRMLVSDTPTLAASIKSESVDALARIGIAATPINLGLASKLVMSARAAAAGACRIGSPRVEMTNACLAVAGQAASRRSVRAR